MRNRPLSILLIEDSPTDALLLDMNLQKVPEFVFQMDHADGLQAGMQKLHANSYDAIILDLGLPDSAGVQTFDKVRARAAETPIIILSGADDRSMLTESLNRGADNYLIKDSADGNRVAIAILSAIRNRTDIGLKSV